MCSWRRGTGLLLSVICLLLVTVSQVRAQETADVVGTVTDASGAVVPGATVTLTNVGTNVTQTTITTSSGDYVFTLLQVGTYVVKVESKGFKTYSAPNIALSAGDRARVDAKMEVGDVTQTVEVSGTVAPALQTDTSTIGSIVPSEAVEDLPLNQRNIIKLVQLSPGATEGQPGSIAAGNRPDDRRMTSALSVNGQDDSTNQNMIDGFDNNTRIIGTIGVRPSIDAIQEVSITTNKYDASVGRTGGGVVEIVTKAGTNDIHGSAFEFFRNKVLNGNPNWNFNEALNLESIKAGLSSVDPHSVPAANPAFRQNQYGGSVGGPVIKNKTFFFVDYEDLAYAQGLAAAFFTVPTYCEHGMGKASSPFAVPCPDGGTSVGDFSDNPAVSLPGTPPSSPGGKWGGGSTTLCTTAQYGTSACPYVVIPQSQINPTGLAFFNMFPLPNTGSAGALTNNYTAALVRVQNAKTIDGRVDEHFSDKDSLFGHITYNGETTINPNGFPNVYITPSTGALASPGASGALKVEPVVTSYAGPNNEDQYFFGLSHVHVFSPTLILNLKVGVMRSQILSFPANQGTEISNLLGIPCNATACVDYTNGSSLVGASGLVHVQTRNLNSGTSYTTIGDTTFIPLGYWDTSLQYFATLTWNKGSHSVRYGLGLIRRRAGVAQSNAPQGQFNFNGSFTGQAMGDLLEGLSTGQSRNNALVQEGFRSWEPSGYIQDDWRTRPWLTLNLGVRYDIFTPYTEVHGRITNYDPYNGLLVGPTIPGAQQTGPTDMVPTPYSDIAPRFGFAATLKGNMVLRGGFGITFMPQNYESQYYFQNAPFDFASSCTLQNNAPNGGSNNSCLTAPIGTYPIGEFGSTQTAVYGTPTSGSTKNSSTLGQQGGTTFANSLPVPVLVTALATNTALYAGTTIQAVPPNLKEAYLEQYNLQLQKQFAGNVVTIGYVGELGRHLANFLGGPFNQNVAANPVQANGGNATLPMSVGGATNDGFGTLPGFPYLATVNVGETPNTGTSSYNALQATLIRRFGKGLTANINYTWSHTMDNFLNTYACTESMFAAPAPCWVDEAKGAGPSLLNATDQGACAAEGASVCKNYYGWQQYAWGNAPNDVQDRIAWGVDYALPFGNSLKGVSGVFIKGWSTNLSGSWQTGIPYTATAVVNNTDISSGYADQICSGKAANPSILEWFNPACFIDPTPGTLGNERAGSLMGPHQKRLDFSLFKTFDLSERVRLQFRTEVFNLLNQTNFGQPSSSIQFTGAAGPNNPNSAAPVFITPPGGTRTTGEITATSGNWNPRQIQFALKVLF
jgi:carboxypeptidase family protein